MAQQLIQIGAIANDKTGDPLRSSFNKINQNFTELYNAVAGGVDIYNIPTYARLRVNNTLDAINTDDGALEVLGGAKVHKSLSVGDTLRVGPGSQSSDFTNPIFIGQKSGNAYVQFAIVNTDASGSSDYTAYADTGTESEGWVDMGMTGSAFNDPNYTITHEGDGYLFTNGLADSVSHGNLVLATGAAGLYKDIVFGTGGFATENEKLRLVNSTGHLLFANGGTLGPEGMGWIGLSNGQSQTPVSMAYKTSTGNWQSSVSLFGGNDTNGEGSVSLYTYNAATSTSNQWTFDSQGNLVFPDGSIQSSAAFTGQTVSKYVLVNVDGGVFGSDDGENWNGPFDTQINGLNRVAVGPDVIVYVGSNTIHYTSAWNVYPTNVGSLGTNQYWSQVKYFPSIEKFVIVGSIDGVPTYAHSSNGQTWTTVSLDTVWAATLDNGNGFGSPGIFQDIATNGTGFLLITGNGILGSFYTTSLTSLTSIGQNEWLNDGMNFSELLYSSSAFFSGWFAFGSGNAPGSPDRWWYNSSAIPGNGSFSNSWGINDISLAFKDAVGYEPEYSEVTIGVYNGTSTVVISTGDGQILYWPAVPDGPFVSIPKPYTSSITNITSASPAVLSYSLNGHNNGEKITISGISGFNGTYYINGSNELFTDNNMTVPFDATQLTYTSGGTVTFSHGTYIDALNYAGGKFYAANDDEEVFVSSNGGATWTEVAALNPGGNGVGVGTQYMNDIDAYISVVGYNTGNFTFSGNTISNPAGMLINTNRGVLAVGTELEGVGAPTHFHIAFDGSNVSTPSSDLFLGDDFNYVKVNAYSTGVTIGATDRLNNGSTYNWTLNNDGSVSFPYLSTNNRTGSADALVFKKSTYQKSIATQPGTSGQPTVERLVLAGGDSYFDGTNWSGEAGDLYLWAGRGANGGDIKVDAGNSLGIGGEEGGTVKVRGGSSTSGNGGFVEITAGYGVVNGGNVTISSGFGGSAGGQVSINAAGNNWTFTNQGDLTNPAGQSIFNKSIDVITSAGSWLVSANVIITDPNVAAANITIILPASPTLGQTITVKNINTGSYVTYVQTNGTIVMENEAGSVGSGVYATLSTTGAYITWVYDGSAFRIIG